MFDRFATAVATWAGHSRAFALACLLIVVRLLTGPFVGWSDTWQLIVNTLTTVITFLMVFLIQASQNRNDSAQQAKLDALIEAVDKARNEMIGIEREPEAVIEEKRPHPGPEAN